MNRFALTSVLLCFAVGVCFGSDFEESIVSSIYGKYSDARLTVLPRSAPDGAVHLQFGVNGVEILKYDHEDSTITFHAWTTMTWHDQNLGWNPENHGGVKSVTVNPKRIWTPDMSLYNSQDKDMSMIDSSLFQAIVQHTGDVLFVPSTILKVACNETCEDINCSFHFGSWVHNGLDLPLAFYDNKEEMDLSSIKPHKHLEVVSNTATLESKVYPCCEEPYPKMSFNLGLRRRRYQ